MWVWSLLSVWEPCPAIQVTERQEASERPVVGRSWTRVFVGLYYSHYYARL